MELAIRGGDKFVTHPFKNYKAHGPKELAAAQRVLDTGNLSGFYGSFGRHFLGGREVRAFESEWAEKFGVKHAVSVNSWTSGLEVALQALMLPPGSEVLVTSWTMSATVAAIIHAGLKPKFIDVDPITYIPKLSEIAEASTSKTRAIVLADIFGLSADWVEITRFAKGKGWYTVSDSAQAPGPATPNGCLGTLADIGGYSLNYHKHIHTGEGGMIVTNDDSLADRAKLLRNHAEAVVGGMVSYQDLDSDLVGHNFRLGEIEAAIGREQLKRLDELLDGRRQAAMMIRDSLSELEGVQLPTRKTDSTNAFYVLPVQVNSTALGVTRDKISEAIAAEGVPIMRRYVNVHSMPFFRKHFPTQLPVTERLQNEEFLGLAICSHAFDAEEIQATIGAFNKVWSQLKLLRDSK